MEQYAILSLGDIETKIEVNEYNEDYHDDSPTVEMIKKINVETQIVPILDIAKYISEKIKEKSPDEFEVDFGISANGENGFLCFAKAGIEAQFNVKMKWKKKSNG